MTSQPTPSQPTPRQPSPVPVDLPVAERLQAAIDRYGLDEVVERSIALLGGANAGEEFLLYLGGRHAQGILDGAPPLYWPEVWGARALLRAWNNSATQAVLAGLANRSWRVREMCAKVVAAQALPVSEALLSLLSDEVARVRAAGARALAEVGGIEHRAPLESLLVDPEIEVRRAAGASLTGLSARLGPSRP
ncbi:MAG: hypothetical protein RI885_2230 [Actinomycetota bacterium]